MKNDWPYDFDYGIVHLVVWTKFFLPVDQDSEVGDMSSATKQLINDFVQQTFEGVDEKVWFKNWSALKSVHALEHFHVLLYRPDEDLLSRILAGPELYSQILKQRADTAKMMDG